MLFVKKEKKMILAFILPFCVFMIYIFKSGYYFYHHNYYIIPFVPVMALVAGYALSQIQKKWIFLTVFILGVVESIGNQQHDFFIKESVQYKMSLESIMDKISQRDDLICINGNGNPQMIYLSHRKGWNCSNNQLSDTTFIRRIIEKNCTFIVINMHSDIDLQNIHLPYKHIFENDDFLILETTSIHE
jgi:general stress protein CsbA